MPRRIESLVKGEIYHVFNHSVGNELLFRDSIDFKRCINLIEYYNFALQDMRYSYLNRLREHEKRRMISIMYQETKTHTDINSFCLMPNHFHLLLKNLTENGVTDLLRKVQNAYAKYYNKRYDRTGSLFRLMYKAKHITGDELFIHVARYIHLNPLTSQIIKKPDRLYQYKWSSYPVYLDIKLYKFVSKNMLLSLHSNSAKRMIDFTMNQVDYQRSLHLIK